jgi:hypothetical protein
MESTDTDFPLLRLNRNTYCDLALHIDAYYF